MTLFLTFCADWLAAVCLLIWGVWFSDKLRTPVSFAPVLGVSFGMVFLQLAGVVRLLWPGAQLLYLGAAVLLVRRPRKSWRQVLGSPAVLAPGNLVSQSAWGVAMAAFGQTPVPAEELLPVYLRLSQAERERQARLAAQAAQE